MATAATAAARAARGGRPGAFAPSPAPRMGIGGTSPGRAPVAADGACAASPRVTSASSV
jgi:hypothetical protein